MAVVLALPSWTAVADPLQNPHIGISDLYSPNYGMTEGRGIPVGAFLLLPTLTAQIEYDDNIFATQTNRQDDYVLTVAPELRLTSKWSRHSLELLAGVKGMIHEEFSSEDTLDAYAALRGAIDVRSDLRVLGEAGYRLGHEARGTGDSFTLFDEPLRYDDYFASLAVWKQFNRLWTTVGARVHSVDMHDPTFNKNSIDQDYRDETTYEIFNRTGYEISPKTSLYAETTYGRSDYKLGDFDGDEYRFLAGVEYEFTRLVKGDFGIGYLKHQYDGASVDDIDTWTYNAQIYWDPTPRARVTVAGKREVGVSLVSTLVTSKLTSELGARVDYELRRDLRLTGIASYEWLEYQDAGFDDKVLAFKTGAEYILNPVWSITLNNNYADYDNGRPGLSYQKNTTSIGARARY